MMTIGVRKSNLEQKLRIGAVGLQSEMLKISDIKNILKYMIDYYKEKAEDAGMDCGGEYEYNEFMEQYHKVESIYIQLNNMKDIWIEQIPVHFQLCKVRGVIPAFDLQGLMEIMEAFYNTQDYILQETKQNMLAARCIMNQLTMAVDSTTKVSNI